MQQYPSLGSLGIDSILVHGLYQFVRAGLGSEDFVKGVLVNLLGE